MKTMQRWRVFGGQLAVMLALTCSSCLFTRLLSFKNQLGSFDEYIRFSNGGRTLTFLKPVVKPGDLTDLTGLQPSRIEVQPAGGQVQTYSYRSLAPEAQAVKFNSLCFTLRFDSRGLETFEYPATVAEVLGTNFVVAAAKALGQSRMIQREYKLDWTLKSGNLADLPVPTFISVSRVLGPAQSSSNTPDGVSAAYAFVLEGADGAVQTNGTMDAVFLFAGTNSLLRHGVIHVGKLQLVVDLPDLKPNP